MRIRFQPTELILINGQQEIALRYADLFKAFLQTDSGIRYEIGQYIKGYAKGMK